MKNRVRPDYPQVNRVDENGTQWIELNRGCKRGCSFCHADPNYRTFEVPEIGSNRVQIIGEGFLYDQDIWRKIEELSGVRHDEKVVYYGLSQGIDFRILTEEMAHALVAARIGIINNKGRWSKGMRFAWDLGLEHSDLAEKTIRTLLAAGYRRASIQVFVLTNWKIPYEVCLRKLEKLKEWGVKVDDCSWETTKREMKPMHWKRHELIAFRRKCRKHNQLINFRGFDPQPEYPKSCRDLFEVRT